MITKARALDQCVLVNGLLYCSKYWLARYLIDTITTVCWMFDNLSECYCGLSRIICGSSIIIGENLVRDYAAQVNER
jgi:hypothetical protein